MGLVRGFGANPFLKLFLHWRLVRLDGFSMVPLARQWPATVPVATLVRPRLPHGDSLGQEKKAIGYQWRYEA